MAGYSLAPTPRCRGHSQHAKVGSHSWATGSTRKASSQILTKWQQSRSFVPPLSVGDDRRFLGMVNQLSKFSEHLARQTRPLRGLLQKGRAWMWGEAQQQSFKQIKESVTKSPALALYDPNRETIISAIHESGPKALCP